MKIVSENDFKNLQYVLHVQIFFLSISNCTRTVQKFKINIFQKDFKKLKKKPFI